MSARVNISEPVYIHREYKNDVPQTDNYKEWKRAALIALPFFTLYKPLSFPLSLSMGVLRTYTSAMHLLESIKAGEKDQISLAVMQTGISVIALAGTFFAHPLGMLISTTHDLLLETAELIQHLQNGDSEKAIESCFKIINQLLYLSLFLRGGLELAIASLTMQIILGLYQSKGEFYKGNYPEATAHLLMVMVRGYQLKGQVNLLQWKWRIEKQYRTLTPIQVIGTIDFSENYQEAYKVVITRFNGLAAHIAYYPSGYIVTLLDTNQQFYCDPAGIVATTNHWTKDAEFNGLECIKHTYTDGGVDYNVYTTRDSQFLVTPDPAEIWEQYKQSEEYRSGVNRLR